MEAGRPDTLAWRQFFPLQRGNAWEYHQGVNSYYRQYYRRREIVAETRIDGQDYFEIRERLYDEDRELTSDSMAYWAYDTTRSTVVSLDSLGDDPASGDPVYDPVTDEALDLQAGGRVTREQRRVGGQVLTWTVKKFGELDSCGSHQTVFAYGVGPIYYVYDLTPHDNLTEKKLVYARVKNEVYGESIVGASAEIPSYEQATAIALGNTYPNPVAAGTRATISMALSMAQLVEVALYDVIGRRQMLLTQRHYGPGRHRLEIPTGRLSPGVYHIIAVSRSSGQPEAEVFVVTK